MLGVEPQGSEQVEQFGVIELGGIAGLRAEMPVDLQGDQAVYAAPDAQREGDGGRGSSGKCSRTVSTRSGAKSGHWWSVDAWALPLPPLLRWRRR